MIDSWEALPDLASDFRLEVWALGWRLELRLPGAISHKPYSNANPLKSAYRRKDNILTTRVSRNLEKRMSSITWLDKPCLSLFFQYSH
jgi:hypothetical protein